jgi:type I restriction enzyme M protein
MTKTKIKPTLTNAQQLGSLIKSARNIMRKDKGLNGDLDRLPMLTWIMFLKFFDDLESINEQKAQLGGKSYKPIIHPPYRWRDWAAEEGGISGGELIHFISDQECTMPDGSKGPGLFEYLRQLRGTDGSKDQRDVIANIFRGVNNRMSSGFLLREIVNKVNGIHFSSTEEIHTLSHLYESMLKEMRDAAGDSGEFYTPRAVVKFMVAVTNPRLGETVLDPACGTGGFLVEAFSHLSKQAKTVQDRRVLQEESIFGGEAKSLPYLLVEMNLLLHGVDSPQIDPRNSLITPLRDIGDKDRADIILTNPPFGGEEEKGIQGNFPEDQQTSETTLLFLQLIMKKLRRLPSGGRAAVVVPDGTLFDKGVALRIRQQLLSQFNLHTIVRLPEGVFAPYAIIPTNLLFFDRTGKTENTWYYEHSLPEGRKSYTKTKPLEYAEFQSCLAWWHSRVENDNAWCVPIAQIEENGFNLDIRNPRKSGGIEYRDPTVLIGAIRSNQETFNSTFEKLCANLDGLRFLHGTWTQIGSFAELIKRPWVAEPGVEVRSLGVKWWGKGAYVAEVKQSEELQADRFLVCKHDLIYNDMWARHGSVAVVPTELDQCVASAHFPTWELDHSVVCPAYLSWCFRAPWFWAACQVRSQGSTGRNAIRKGLFRTVEVPLPSPEEQQEIVDTLNCLESKVRLMQKLHSETALELDALLPAALNRSKPA